MIDREEKPVVCFLVSFENEIYQKLVKAQVGTRSNPNRLSHDEVFGYLRQKIADYKGYSKNI